MYLYGASGHAKVIIEMLEHRKITVDGLFDDDPDKTELMGYVVERYKASLLLNAQVIISIGNNQIRKVIASKITTSFGSVFHPFTSISKRCNVGDGSVLMAGVCINSYSIIGSHVIVNTNASVDHDCNIGDFVHIAPGAVLCGDVTVGDGTLIGAGSVVLPGVNIGKWCTIGAGAIVVKDIPNNVTVVGNPCRELNGQRNHE